MLLLFLSREVADRPCSDTEEGDSGRHEFDIREEDGKLLSLSLASSIYMERLLEIGWGWETRLLLCDLGVGHSIGLLEPVETACDEDRLSSRMAICCMSRGVRRAEAMDLKPT